MYFSSNKYRVISETTQSSSCSSSHQLKDSPYITTRVLDACAAFVCDEKQLATVIHRAREGLLRASEHVPSRIRARCSLQEGKMRPLSCVEIRKLCHDLLEIAQDDSLLNEDREIAKRLLKKANALRSKLEKAKDRLIRSNLRLVASIAKKIHSRSLTFLDLLQEGSVRLMAIAEQFDWGRGLKFSTFGYMPIQQAMIRAEQSAETVPASEIPLDTLEHPRTSDGLREFIAKEFHVLLFSALNKLDPNARKVLCLRFGIGHEPHTLAETGKLLGKNHQVVARIQNRAVAEMKEMLQDTSALDMLYFSQNDDVRGERFHRSF